MPIATMTDRSVIDTLEAALGSADPERRQAVLDHVTDLFVGAAGRYNATQVTLFDQVFLKLSRDIEVRARRRLAERLATLGHAPAATARQLALDPSPAVAAPILRNVLQLEDSDIIAVATTGSDEHLMAISGRPHIDETVTAILVDRGSPEVARELAGNATARLSDSSFGKLVSRAMSDPALATAVGTRRDIPRHHFVALIRTASAAVRVKLAAADPLFAREVEESVADIVADIGRETNIMPADPILAKAETARLMHPDRSGDVDTAAAARARKYDQAVQALSLLGRVPLDVAERAMSEGKPDMLMIIAKLGGLSWKSLKGMLQIQAGRDMDIDELLRARKDYEHLQLMSAQQVLASYRARVKRENAA
jgi:uncharacterized protein (DUF2336 family)